MRHTYIVSYDIADPKRLRKVFRVCQDYGNHLQYSVFECQFTPIQATAVFYKPDGVAATLIIGGAFPGTPGYINGSGAWELGWT